jgi:hypothetical protein
LAYQDNLFGDNHEIIDIVKVVCESVDAQVVMGAPRLLNEGRIRFIMWETPNSAEFPVKSGDNDTEIKDFGGLIAHNMDSKGMACYFPGNKRHVKLMGCWDEMKNAPKCKRACPYLQGCSLDHGNTLCVNRKLVPTLYQAITYITNLKIKGHYYIENRRSYVMLSRAPSNLMSSLGEVRLIISVHR